MPHQPAPELIELQRRLVRLVASLAALTVVGTVGYMLIEHWSWFDALYMTVITVATVGFQEVHPLGPAGRFFTMLLIGSGAVVLVVLLGAAGEVAVSAAASGVFRRRRMQREIDGMTGHYIVCGHGRVGREVTADLRRGGASVVVVEANLAAVAGFDGPSIVGDASDDAVLGRAGIARAKGLVSAAGDDAVNVLIVLTARALAPTLPIVARADRPDTEPKLRRAGATQVVSPHRIGGRRLAAQLLQPRVSDFLDLVMHSEQLEVWLEDVPVGVRSAALGRTVGALLSEHPGASILAVHGAGTTALQLPPLGEVVLQAGDTLIALGTRQQLAALRRAVAG